MEGQRGKGDAVQVVGLKYTYKYTIYVAGNSGRIQMHIYHHNFGCGRKFRPHS